MIHPDLEHLLLWTDGWNGYDALAPQHEAVELASQWLTFYDEIRQPHWDEKPLVTGDGWGGVVFWQSCEERKLEVFINIEGTVDYMQVDRQNIHDTQIDDGDITSEGQFMVVWQWLYGSEEDEK